MKISQYSLADFTHNLSGNLFGGVTAAVVALPLALAFGISSGIGAGAGLWGAIVVGLVASAFGGTRPQISGPTGPMTVVVTAMTAQFMSQYPENGLAYVFTVVFLGGVFQALIGLFRLGKYIIMVPYPVISGFMTGIGVIIIVLQLGPLLGHRGEGSIVTTVLSLPALLQSPNLPSLTIGLAGMALLFLWRGRVNRVFPSPLLVLILGTLVVVFAPKEFDLAIIGEIPSAIPSLRWPAFTWNLAGDMISSALMLAVLGSIDSLLTSLVADNMGSATHDSDRELIGQGVGNSLAGLLGGLPGAGATMRTVVNIRAGGDGPLSGAVHALVLLSAVLGLGALFKNIPVAALSAVLIKVGIDIIDWPFIARMRQLPRFTVALMILVLLLTVFVDLITAVFVGVFIKNLMLVDQLSDLELGRVCICDGSTEEQSVTQEELRYLRGCGGDVVLVRITGPLSYAVNRGLTMRFGALAHPRLLIVDVSSASIIGVTTLMAIETLVEAAKESGTSVKLIDNHTEPSMDYQQRRLIQMIGSSNRFASFSGAINAPA